MIGFALWIAGSNGGLSCQAETRFTLTSTSIKTRRMTMNELVTQRCRSRRHRRRHLAEKALGMMLGFLQREAADGPVAKMIEAIPGAADLVAQFNGEGAGGGGLLGGLMSAVGGGGVMGARPAADVRRASAWARSPRLPRKPSAIAKRICRRGRRRRSRRFGPGPQPVRLISDLAIVVTAASGRERLGRAAEAKPEERLRRPRRRAVVRF